MLKIPNSNVGLVGGIGANMICTGLVIDQDAYGRMIYVSLVSPTSGIDALYAKLNNGDSVNVAVNLDSQTVFPGDKAKTYYNPVGTKVLQGVKRKSGNDEGFTIIRKTLPEIRMEHAIIMNKAFSSRKLDKVVEEELAKENVERIAKKVYFMATEEKLHTIQIIGQTVKHAVDIAVFPEWYPYIAQKGRESNLITKMECYGGVRVYGIKLDIEYWSRIIKHGLKVGALELVAGVRY